jgi:hypothetical protein
MRERQRKKLSYHEVRELVALPPLSRRSRTSSSGCEPKRRRAEFYRESIRAVLARIEAIGPELEAAIARWIELEERS